MAAFRHEEVHGCCDLNCFLVILTPAEGNIGRFNGPVFWHKSNTFLLFWVGISFVAGQASALNR